METKYKLGDVLEVIATPGWSGEVVLIECWSSRSNRYALDLMPGALGHYTWMEYRTKTGEATKQAVNWFNEDQLKPMSEYG